MTQKFLNIWHNCLRTDAAAGECSGVACPKVESTWIAFSWWSTGAASSDDDDEWTETALLSACIFWGCCCCCRWWSWLFIDELWTSAGRTTRDGDWTAFCTMPKSYQLHTEYCITIIERLSMAVFFHYIVGPTLHAITWPFLIQRLIGQLSLSNNCRYAKCSKSGREFEVLNVYVLFTDGIKSSLHLNEIYLGNFFWLEDAADRHGQVNFYPLNIGHFLLTTA